MKKGLSRDFLVLEEIKVVRPEMEGKRRQSDSVR